MRRETRAALVALVIGLILAVADLAVLSGGFATAQGSGGVIMLLTCVFGTLILFCLLTMRALAAGEPVEPELDDGLTALAVTAWVFALAPPQAYLFSAENPIDEVALAYLPVSLLTVLFVLAGRALWKPREVRFILVRLGAALAASLLVLFVLRAVQGPPSA